MSTTGTVINYVFNAINQYGEQDGAPLHNIVDVVSHNLANDNVVPRPRNILTHTRRAIDYGLKNGLILQLRPDMYKLNTIPEYGSRDDGDNQPMEDDYEDNDGNSYESDDDLNRRMDYPRQPYYYRGNQDYHQEHTENPYYKDRVLNTDKKNQKRSKGGFLPAQIPACPVGPTDPQEPTSPGEPRPPLDPPPYTGRIEKSSRHSKQKPDIMNKISHGSPDNEKMNDDDHDCDFEGDSEDFDNDICSEDFNDFEDDAAENDDDGQEAGDEHGDDDEDAEQDIDYENSPEIYDEARDQVQMMRQAKFKRPSYDKKGSHRGGNKNNKQSKKLKKNDSCSTCGDFHSDGYSDGALQRKRPSSRLNEPRDAIKKGRFNNRYHTMAVGLPSHKILKRHDRSSLKKRLQLAAGRLSQPH
ncbi:probable ATP-dependent helicase PF08_0048 [Chrysoperla carnea]|uniref:probable ATP-dependent helicase PF08_0048 n=1 Tax=Chrysoperla carnea TaxID=189513 RepID=UPI001D0931E8|nr:probable ATP-dependent helicase PF08_0048 [Chrysoperla carnea]